MIVSWKKESQLPTNHGKSVVETAHHALEANALFRGRSQLIRMDEQEGTLVLRGHLPSYYMKQMLQTILRGVEGIQKIDNRVDVTRPDQ